jgi:DNA repair protein RadA/Sms
MWNTAGTGRKFEDDTVLLSDAKLAEVQRVQTGIVDGCFGGDETSGVGIVRTSIALLGGDPGAGKTTLCLQLSDFFAGKFNQETLYIANEQDPTEIKTTGGRLQLKNMHLIRIVKAMGGVTADIGAYLLRYKPCLIILDSVTKWAGEDMNVAVTICQRLKDYTVRLNAPSLVVNQVTKGGEHAGLNKMQHAVDATMLFEVWGENPSDPRRLHVRKNRFGPAPVSQYYEMTGHGLFEISEEEAMLRVKESERPKDSDDSDELEEEPEAEEEPEVEEEAETEKGELFHGGIPKVHWPGKR